MLSVGIFLTITVGSVALFRAVANLARPSHERFRQRMAAEFRVAPTTATSLYKDVAGWEEELESEAGAVRGAASPGRWQPRAEDFLREGGVALTVRQAAAAVGGLAVVAGTLGFVFGGWLPGLTGLAAGAVVPALAVNARRKLRAARYLQQLVGAFELMARVLRAGQSVPEAFRAAAEAFGEPLAGEFARCIHQIEHGIRPDAAFQELSQRSGILELRMFVVATAVQRQTGGNLSEVIDRMAAVARARLRLRSKLRALTAEGRMQSATLVVLPFVTFLAMYVLNRQYAETLLVHWRLLAATAGCMGVGVLWIRSIMKFEG